MVMRGSAWDVRMLPCRQVEAFHDPELRQEIQGTEERGPADAEAVDPLRRSPARPP